MDAAWRGVADPLHGDAPNKAVRDMAQECMNAIFDTSTASEQMHSAGRMQGFGSEGGAAGGGGPGSFGAGGGAPGGYGAGAPGAPGGGYVPRVESGAYSTGKMQGFGNPQFPNKPDEPSKVAAFASGVASGLKDGLSKISSLRDKAADGGYSSHGSYSGGGVPGGPQGSYGASGGFASVGGFSGGGGGGGGGSCFQPPAATMAPTPSTPAAPHQPGRAGGGWGDPDPAPAPAPAPAMPAPAASSAARVSQAPAPAGDYESRLVNEITQAGGVRAAVPREDLRKFCDTCKSLNGGAMRHHPVITPIHPRRRQVPSPAHVPLTFSLPPLNPTTAVPSRRQQARSRSSSSRSSTRPSGSAASRPSPSSRRCSRRTAWTRRCARSSSRTRTSCARSSILRRSAEAPSPLTTAPPLHGRVGPPAPPYLLLLA